MCRRRWPTSPSSRKRSTSGRERRSRKGSGASSRGTASISKESPTMPPVLPETATALLDRIEQRQAVVGVIGLGYVGLPLALVFAEAGFHVIGFDVDAKKTETLARGESYISHIGADRVRTAFLGGKIA